MQWDKVKSILLIILILVDGFLLAGLAGRYIMAEWRQRTLLEDIKIVLERYDVTCGEELSVPEQRNMIALEADRSRLMEETFARTVLTGTVERSEREDGQTIFEGDNGTVRWRPDGTVYAAFTPKSTDMPGTGREMKKAAAELLARCGVSLAGGKLKADLENGTVTLTAAIAGMPVFNRSLTVAWKGEGQILLEGQWFFGVPYATTADRERLCSAEDALLQVARGASEQGKVGRIDSIELGYRMDAGAGARLQLLPYWRVRTDKGTVFVDALK